MHPCLTAVGKFINIYPDSDFEGLLVVGELLSVLQKFPVSYLFFSNQPSLALRQQKTYWV